MIRTSHHSLLENKSKVWRSAHSRNDNVIVFRHTSLDLIWWSISHLVQCSGISCYRLKAPLKSSEMNWFHGEACLHSAQGEKCSLISSLARSVSTRRCVASRTERMTSSRDWRYVPVKVCGRRKLLPAGITANIKYESGGDVAELHRAHEVASYSTVANANLNFTWLMLISDFWGYLWENN